MILTVGPYTCSEQILVAEAWASPLNIMTAHATTMRRKENIESSFTRDKTINNISPTKKRKRKSKKSSIRSVKKHNQKSNYKNNESGPSVIIPTKPKSIGEAVQQAQNVPDLLEVASQFWLPTDVDLPTHLRTQAIHHEKRQRWGAQLLSKLGVICLQTTTVWEDPRFARAVMAAILPFPANNKSIATDKELRILRETLLGLHTLAGSMEPSSITLNEKILESIKLLLERSEINAKRFSLSEAMEVRWAARGLLAKLGSAVSPIKVSQDKNDNLQEYLASAFTQLESRVNALPFDILPGGVDFSDLHGNGIGSQKDIMTSLQESIPFKFDTIVTRQGTSVTERRGTAWVAEDGIGALAYSGKLMPPSPMPPLVRALMGQVETAIGAPTKDFFDCSLCNFYPDGDTACKFHTDPEHGTVWERLNCVVSVGNSRRFAFRPIPEKTSWLDWETSDTAIKSNTENPGATPAVIRLFPGDIVSMWGDCNDLFHHAVYPESDHSNTEETESGRLSLVLKRAMVNGNKGRRGHGLAGEGRRSRRGR